MTKSLLDLLDHPVWPVRRRSLLNLAIDHDIDVVLVSGKMSEVRSRLACEPPSLAVCDETRRVGSVVRIQRQSRHLSEHMERSATGPNEQRLACVVWAFVELVGHPSKEGRYGRKYFPLDQKVDLRSVGSPRR